MPLLLNLFQNLLGSKPESPFTFSFFPIHYLVHLQIPSVLPSVLITVLKSFCSCCNSHSCPVTSHGAERSLRASSLSPRALQSGWLSFWHFPPLRWSPQWPRSLLDEGKLAACRWIDFVCPQQYFKELFINFKKSGYFYMKNLYFQLFLKNLENMVALSICS